MTPQKISLQEKLAAIQDHWHPRLIAELNDQHVRLAKFKGEFVWHQHEREDEFFLVLEGRFRMDFRDGFVWLDRGDMIVVPRGVEHKPSAEEEVSVLLFEPSSTINTGNVVNAFTRPTTDPL